LKHGKVITTYLTDSIDFFKGQTNDNDSNWNENDLKDIVNKTGKLVLFLSILAKKVDFTKYKDGGQTQSYQSC
jgi:hypothetical protein